VHHWGKTYYSIYNAFTTNREVVEMIIRALISVSDKTGLEDLVKTLGEYDVEIVSSGGTAKKIKELGHKKLTEVSEYTGHPESPGGLLKTLHPRVHGGLLLNPTIPEHRSYMEKHGIKPFELVVVNLYPFEAAVAKGADLLTAAENIDIGGPTMIRSAAKASLLYGIVAVVTDPSQYRDTIAALKSNKGDIPADMKRELAEKAYARTSDYDAAIATYLEKERKKE
jgi:phosphoribosylaminoimidazolecarboxamide formyltransferase / IMP cyclohydrolase